MNCRRMNHLLSAFIDGELSGREMNEVRAHLDVCRTCQHDHETLRATKRMVASLALKVPREELEGLLIAQGRRHEAARTQSPAYIRLVAWFLGTHPITLQTSSSNLSGDRGFLRARPLAATALLSLAGLWAASASLDTSAFRAGALASANGWYTGSNTAFGGQLPIGMPAGPAMGSSYPSSGYMGASLMSSASPLRPPAALAVWMARGSDAPSPDEAVSLPLAASGSAPSTWGRGGENVSASPYNAAGSPTAFLPAPSAGTNLVTVSYRGLGH